MSGFPSRSETNAILPVGAVSGVGMGGRVFDSDVVRLPHPVIQTINTQRKGKRHQFIIPSW
jgi:hypothetical protein